MNGEKKQLDALVKFTGKPKRSIDKRKTSRWKKFLALINPFTSRINDKLIEAEDLARRYSESEIKLRNSEAEKFASEAAERASNADLVKNQNVQLINSQIEDIYKNDLPAEAKMMQISNLLYNNPEIMNQISKIQDQLRVLKAVNFTEVDFNIKKDTRLFTKVNVTKNGLEIDLDDLNFRANLNSSYEPAILNEDAIKNLKDALYYESNVNQSEYEQDFDWNGSFDVKAGEQIEHLRFGKGVILSVDGGDEHKKALIDFEDVGEKQLLLKFTKLKKLGSS